MLCISFGRKFRSALEKVVKPLSARKVVLDQKVEGVLYSKIQGMGILGEIMLFTKQTHSKFVYTLQLRIFNCSDGLENKQKA